MTDTKGWGGSGGEKRTAVNPRVWEKYLVEEHRLQAVLRWVLTVSIVVGVLVWLVV